MFRLAVPVFRISDPRAARDFYCRQLGFKLEFAHPSNEAEPCYMGVSRDGVWMHLSSFPGDGRSGGVALIVVDSIDELHQELVSREVTIDSGPVDQTWGTREMYVKDADGNALRFAQKL